RGIGHAPLPARGRSADALPARAGKPFASGRGPPPHGLAHALAAVEGELRAAPAHRAHHLSHLGLRLGDGGGGLPDALPLALARGVTRLGAAETKAALQDPRGRPANSRHRRAPPHRGLAPLSRWRRRRGRKVAGGRGGGVDRGRPCANVARSSFPSSRCRPAPGRPRPPARGEAPAGRNPGSSPFRFVSLPPFASSTARAPERGTAAGGWSGSPTRSWILRFPRARRSRGSSSRPGRT